MRRGAPPADAPPRVAARTLRVRPAQEHLVRRLGQALVLQWDALSDEMQDLLIDQAVTVDDSGVATAEEVESFVRSVTTMALKPKPQAQDAPPLE